jgi:hypothetical protein
VGKAEYVEERYFIRVFEIFRQAGIALGSKK